MPGTVTVACRLPNGLHLDVYDPDSLKWVDVNGVKICNPVRKARITLNGTSAARRLESNFSQVGETSAVIGGFGLTHNIDADLWVLCEEQNKDTPMFRSGVVFAHAKPGEAQAKARDLAKMPTPLKPMDPNKPAPGVEINKDAHKNAA